MSTEIERIKEIIKVKGMNKSQFMKDLGYSHVAFLKWEKGAKIGEKTLKLIEMQYNINPNWLRTGQGSMFLSEKKESAVFNTDKGLLTFPKEKDKLDYVEIPAYLDVKASAGTGAFVGMEVSKMIPVSKDIIKNAYGLVILAVAGDSMEPAILNKDKIIIDTNDKYTLKKNKIYVIRKDNELYIKRYNDCNSNMCIFTSDNTKYPSIILDKNDNSAVIGRLKGIFMREVN